MAKNEAKQNKKENNKNKKSFFKDFKAELKKVVWPTPKQLVNNTVAVITIVLITAAIVFVLDFVFETVNKYGIDKVRDAVVTNFQNNSEAENTENSENSEEGTDSTDAEGENTDAEETTESTEGTQETENTETNPESNGENTTE